MRHKKLTACLSVVLPLFLAVGCSQSQPVSSSELPATSAEVSSSEGLATAKSARGGRPGSAGVVYVTGQGLYYDTFVVVDPLPMKGPFQRLANGQTEFGPGDPGYLGGRWWEDTNGNGIQDVDDHFFLCPLLPPGRETP